MDQAFGRLYPLLFLASAVSDWFVYGQYRVLNEQQRDTREQLRASVTQQAINEVLYADRDGKVTGYVFIPQFYNSGGTRTAHFNGWVSVKYFEEKVPNNIDLNKPYEKVDFRDVVIGPNSPLQLAAVTLTPDEIAKVQRKALPSYGDVLNGPIFSNRTSFNRSSSVAYSTQQSRLTTRLLFCRSRFVRTVRRTAKGCPFAPSHALAPR
jgi:hypothetical protein